MSSSSSSGRESRRPGGRDSSAGSRDASRGGAPFVPPAGDAAGDGVLKRAMTFVGPTDPPERIGEYGGLRLIGQGGMGSVWEAKGPRGRVAIKLLHRNFTATNRDLVRLVREGDLARSIRHPNVVAVHEIDGGELGLYIVMEFIDGRPLDEAARHVPVVERLRLLVQVARGLEAAHEAGIVHRDVKPANVLVDRAGVAKVTDFGLAYAVDGGRITGTSTALGTPYYMAPEQLRREHRKVGPPTDVWALGVMMHEMLEGENPFRGRLESVLYRDPPPIRCAWPLGLREPLLRVCRKALSKETHFRYGHAGRFADALEGVLSTKVRRLRPLYRRQG